MKSKKYLCRVLWLAQIVLATIACPTPTGKDNGDGDSNSTTFQIKYEVTGSGPFTPLVSYNYADGTAAPAFAPTLPWTMTITVDNTQRTYVVAAGGTPTGAASVTASAYKDGNLVQTATTTSADIGGGFWIFNPIVVQAAVSIP